MYNSRIGTKINMTGIWTARRGSFLSLQLCLPVGNQECKIMFIPTLQSWNWNHIFLQKNSFRYFLKAIDQAVVLLGVWIPREWIYFKANIFNFSEKKKQTVLLGKYVVFAINNINVHAAW